MTSLRVRLAMCGDRHGHRPHLFGMLRYGVRRCWGRWMQHELDAIRARAREMAAQLAE